MCMYMHVYVYVCTCMHSYIYIYAHVCVHHTCMYIHARTSKNPVARRAPRLSLVRCLMISPDGMTASTHPQTSVWGVGGCSGGAGAGGGPPRSTGCRSPSAAATGTPWWASTGSCCWTVVSRARSVRASPLPPPSGLPLPPPASPPCLPSLWPVEDVDGRTYSNTICRAEPRSGMGEEPGPAATPPPHPPEGH